MQAFERRLADFLGVKQCVGDVQRDDCAGDCHPGPGVAGRGDLLRKKIADGQFEFSAHATHQAIRRYIPVSEIREALLAGWVIEDYPDDKYGPSYLILGRAATGRPLHIQCSDPSRPLVKIITVYQPDPNRWNADFTQRADRHEP